LRRPSYRTPGGRIPPAGAPGEIESYGHGESRNLAVVGFECHDDPLDRWNVSLRNADDDVLIIVMVLDPNRKS
jgi:hypothetical protein